MSTTNNQLKFKITKIDSAIKAEALKPVPLCETAFITTHGRSLFYKGEYHLMSADPSVGKSFVTFAAMKQHLDAGGLCLYVDCEADELTSARRLLQLGVDVENSLYFETRPVGDFELLAGLAKQPGDMDVAFFELLEQHIAKARMTYGAEMFVIFDGFANLAATLGLDENDNTAMAKLGVHFKNLAMHTGATVLSIDHKAKGASAIQSGSGKRNSTTARGASAKAGNPAAVFSLFADDKNQSPAQNKAGSIKLAIDKDRHGVISQKFNELRVQFTPCEQPEVSQDNGGVCIEFVDGNYDGTGLYVWKLRSIYDALLGADTGLTSTNIRDLKVESSKSKESGLFDRKTGAEEVAKVMAVLEKYNYTYYNSEKKRHFVKDVNIFPDFDTYGRMAGELLAADKREAEGLEAVEQL